jgi:filamentous hemagglutinin
MAELTKQALQVENNTQFPNNNAGVITPTRLRGFNSDMIDSLVDEIGYNADSASWNNDINELQNFSSSLDNNFASQTEFETYTASQDTKNATLASYTGSNDTKWNTLGGQTGSYVTSTITGSSLVTASFDNGTRNLTFTKGDATTFNVNIPDVSGSILPSGLLSSSVTNFTDYSASVDSRILAITGSGGSINTSSFATTGSNTFTGNQTISTAGNTQLNIISTGDGQANIEFQAPNANFAAYGDFRINNNGQFGGSGSINITAKNNQINVAATEGIKIGVPTALGNVIDGGAITINVPSGSQQLQLTGSLVVSNTLTASLQEGYAWVGNGSNVSTLVATSSFGGGGTIDTGSFATTGSNTFAGENVFNSTSSFVNSIKVGNPITAITSDKQLEINNVSGSLVLASPGSANGLSGLNHIQSTFGNMVNLMFKSDNTQATTIVNGSGNIFHNPSAPLAGFNRYMSGLNIFTLGGAVPQISQSMAFSPTIAANVGAGAIVMRGPVSASAWNINNNVNNGSILFGQSAVANAEKLTSTVTVSGNVIASTAGLSFIANQTALTGSAVNANGNIMAASATLIMSSSALSFSSNYVGSATTVRNAFFNGSPGLGTVLLSNNQLVGPTTVEVRGEQAAGTTTAVAFNNNTVGGGGNIIYLNTETPRIVGTAAYHQGLRNFIFGSNLVITGSSLSNDAGTLGSAFLGRNAVDDGIRNKTSDTVFSVGTGTSTANRKTGFLIDSGSNTFVEGTLNVSGSTSTTGSITIQSGSGDLFVHGNKQFNVGAFSSLVTQSGSAGVSQSVNFEVTDISEGVSVVSNSRITLANSGTYSITFSAQLKEIGGTDSIYLWLKKNGTNVANTGTKTVVRNNDENIMTVEYIVQSSASDYYEIVFQNVNGHAQLYYESASGNIPATPSIIITVKQVR